MFTWKMLCWLASSTSWKFPQFEFPSTSTRERSKERLGFAWIIISNYDEFRAKDLSGRALNLTFSL
jgi:hypothetical protein